MSDKNSSSSTTPIPLTPNDATVELSPDPPLPPNWKENMEKTILSLAPYKLFPVTADTLEYTTIAALLAPLQIHAVHQIVNPMLFSRFANTRREMLLSKSDDLALLLKLSPDEKKITQQMHLALSFTKDAQVAACPYNDNVALLFHCTKNKNNVDTILLQGLDERLGQGGLFGRGIYFASDPKKSLSYDGCGGIIFIFMVLLGDCLSVNQNNNFVREPQKQPCQQRNVMDINFDSIIGQSGACEYVVYNRYQCCPLYKISYAAGSSGAANSIYSQSNNSLPPFRWTSSTTGSIAMPSSSSSSDWPFLAKTIFAQMGVPQIQEMEIDMEPLVEIEESAESIDNKMAVLISLGFTNDEMNLDILTKHSFDIDRTINALLEGSGGAMINESEILINNKLATLSNMGFASAEINAQILKKNSYDLNKCICELLEQGAAGAQIDDVLQSQPSENALKEAGPEQIQKSNENDAELEDCPICSDEIDESTLSWKILVCGHKLCDQCYKQIETTRTTMAGIPHTFTKCPFCMKTSGIEIGTCPDGKMTTSIVATPCQGYEGYQSIRIQYDVQCPPYRLYRIAYLPNNDEGNELLRRLQTAWDRRICFTIGTSASNGQENVLVWNIHHKTAQNGGVARHGFPDAAFMARCKMELNAFGIE